MPAPIDWPGIRTNSVTLGIRGAARAAAADLPDDERDRFVERVMKRASREGWETQRKAVMVSAGMSAKVVREPIHALPLSANVRTGAEIAANADAELSKRGRSASLRFGTVAMEHLAQKAEESPDEAILLAPQGASLVKVLSAAGEWGDKIARHLTVNILTQPDLERVEHVSAKVIDVEQG